MEERLETLAAEQEQDVTSAETEEVEVMETEGEAEEAETESKEEPNPLSEENAKLKAQLEREKSRNGGVIGDYRLAVKVINGVMDEYGITFDEAAKFAGIEPRDLEARIKGAEKPSNVIETANQEFLRYYNDGGFKKLLDKQYGTDTLQYINAFDRAASIDAELREEYIHADPIERVSLVMEKGKEYLESGIEDVNLKTVATMKKRIAELEAKLSSKAEAKAEEPLQVKQPLPSAQTSNVMAVFNR